MTDTVKRIFELIDQRKLSVYQVSKATGISQSRISNWKSGGGSPKGDALTSLANYFGVSVDYLLGIEKPAIQEDNGLTDAERELIDLFDRVPEDKQEFVLQQVEAALRLAGLLDE